MTGFWRWLVGGVTSRIDDMVGSVSDLAASTKVFHFGFVLLMSSLFGSVFILESIWGLLIPLLGMPTGALLIAYAIYLEEECGK